MFECRRLAAEFSFALFVALLAPCLAASPGSLSGRVLDVNRRPIAGATVRLHKFNDPFSGRAGQWGPAISEAETDREGGFRFLESDSLPFDGKFILACESDGYANAFRKTTLETGHDAMVQITMHRPVSVALRLADEAGRPVRGASLRRLNVHGENGEFDPRRDDFEEFGLALESSDEQGRLRLPELPQGAVVDATVSHPDLAAIEIKDIALRAENMVEATMKPGVSVQLQVAPAEGGASPSHATVLMRHERLGSAHPSTIWLERLDLDSCGEARLTAETGAYSILLLHEDFYLVATNLPPDEGLRLDASQKHHVTFRAHKKVRVRGRVFDAASGRPAAGVTVEGEIAREISRAASDGSGDLRYVASVDTDERGEYAIALAAGRARLTASAIGYVAEGEGVEIVVVDGSTAIADLKIRRLPKVSGTVRDDEGRPVARAIVRMRGQMLGMRPAVTDEQGRFELALPWLRYDSETGEPQYVQPLAAFHPFKPLSTEMLLDLEDAAATSNLTLVLEPRACRELLLEPLKSPDAGAANDAITARAAEAGVASLFGKPAPELDGLAWLNSPRENMRLADFRGKYVLLDFWTTWCGPCHAQFPTIKLLHDLYRDRGFAVIGVHDNSVAPEVIREHAKRHGLNFPIVIDTPEGGVLSRYKRHGVRFYPTYLLIGPDGNVLLHGGVIPGPDLDDYMLEIVRAYLVEP